MERPNILYIHSHDSGRYIQPYGYAVPTPRLQGLAEQGVLFRQAFCVNPTCSPSRAGLLTGAYPHSPANGMFGLAHLGWRLNDYKKHLLHILKAHGYEAILSGAQHIIDEEHLDEIGYDRFLGGPAPKHEGAEQFAADYLRSKPSKPFFLSVGFHETHRKFPPAAKDINPNFVQPPTPLPDTPETRADMAEYLTMARELDRKMGLVFDALEESGLAENTLIICTTDHGLAFPNMKCSLTAHGTGVMLIMKGPDGFSGGRAIDQLVSHVDIFPTLCDLLQIDRPDWLQGESLLPLLEDPATPIRDAVFSEVNVHAAYQPMRSVRTQHWNYIKRLYPQRTRVLPNTDCGLSKTYLMENGWHVEEEPTEELYDLLLDPNESNNLAATPKHEAVLQEMRERLLNHQLETQDPMLDGHFPIPAYAVAVPQDGLAPSETKHPLSTMLNRG